MRVKPGQDTTSITRRGFVTATFSATFPFLDPFESSRTFSSFSIRLKAARPSPVPTWGTSSVSFPYQADSIRPFFRSSNQRDFQLAVAFASPSILLVELHLFELISFWALLTGVFRNTWLMEIFSILTWQTNSFILKFIDLFNNENLLLLWISIKENWSCCEKKNIHLFSKVKKQNMFIKCSVWRLKRMKKTNRMMLIVSQYKFLIQY